MPYKVYTYEDPYKLNQTDFWEEIATLPHFCVARTLVNGLKDISKQDIHALLCPLDDLVKHQDVYKSWTDNIGLRIQQYSALTAVFNKKSNDGSIDPLFRQSLGQNQTHFLDAIRLFIELGINPSVIDRTKGNKEQRLFVDVLEDLCQNSLFSFPEAPSLPQLKKVIESLAVKELEDYEKRDNSGRDREWYKSAIKNTKKWNGKSLVIHGVHQFSPAQLRLILALDKLGITVVFLFNYQSKYSEIYSSWECIVKNFEQIDGDILQSKHQSERGDNKVYHFACLSDRDLNCKVDDLLPWPLTDAFIRKAYSPADLQFQVYYSALGERGSFLRYALFYGLCFNYEDTRLSYVKQYGDEITEPYALLSILGLETTSGVLSSLINTDDYSISVKRSNIGNIDPKPNELMDMYLCPYRFFMDYVLEDSPVIKDGFLYQKLYENLVIELVWKKLQRNKSDFASQRIKAEVSGASDRIKSFFSFWKNTEIDDLERRAENFIRYQLIGTNPFVPSFDRIHMDVRKQYGLARYDIDISDREPRNPYQSFESKADRKYPKKTYSYYKINPKKQAVNRSDMIEDIKSYLNDTKDSDQVAIPAEEWCRFCHHKGVCLKPFLSEL